MGIHAYSGLLAPYSIVGAYQQSEEHTPFIFRTNPEDQVGNTSDLHIQIPVGNLIPPLLIFSWLSSISIGKIWDSKNGPQLLPPQVFPFYCVTLSDIKHTTEESR
jgi:hypothetical protein